MNTRTYIPLAATVAIVVIGIIVGLAPQQGAERVSVIVQATELATARAAVLDAGGEVTHELGIIRAVGVDLTAEQLEALTGVDGLTVHANSSVTTASVCSVSSAGDLRFDKNKLLWDLQNTGAASASISRIDITWPADNKKLKKVKLAGKEIYRVALEPTSAVIIDGWRGSVADRTLDPGQVGELKLEFERDAVADAGQYMIEVGFAEGCSVVGGAVPTPTPISDSPAAHTDSDTDARAGARPLRA